MFICLLVFWLHLLVSQRNRLVGLTTIEYDGSWMRIDSSPKQVKFGWWDDNWNATKVMLVVVTLPLSSVLVYLQTKNPIERITCQKLPPYQNVCQMKRDSGDSKCKWWGEPWGGGMHGMGWTRGKGGGRWGLGVLGVLWTWACGYMGIWGWVARILIHMHGCNVLRRHKSKLVIHVMFF